MQKPENVLMVNFFQLCFRFTADGLWPTGKDGLTPRGTATACFFLFLCSFYPHVTVSLMVSDLDTGLDCQMYLVPEKITSV